VEVKEREMWGGKWVKRPAGAKGFESRKKFLRVAEAPCALATSRRGRIIAGKIRELVVVIERFPNPSNVLFWSS
jgi:hypothetical protein